MICDLGSGWDPCIDEPVEEDECSTVDNYYCSNGDVYRCEEEGGRKVLKLSDTCTYNEKCPDNVNEVKQCQTVLEYDLMMEYASSGTTVNKQPGDKLNVRIKLDSASNVNIDYNSNVFTLLEGNCDTGDLDKGINNCIFEIDSSAEGKYDFTLNEDTETVNVIDNPYAIYLTNSEQLYKRYDKKQSVDVLLEKTYEKASKYRGIVYDLSVSLSKEHPFNDEFVDYDEPIVGGINE